MKKDKKKQSWFIIISSLAFILGFVIVLIDYIHPIINNKLEEKALKEFYIQEEVTDNNEQMISLNSENNNSKYEFIAVLKIPKIHLEKGLFSKSSKYNDINYGIEILKESDNPGTTNSTVILASHSGTANVSYFKFLDKLNIGDKASIIYKGTEYVYEVIDIYDIEKTGKLAINKIDNISTLVLITCKFNTNKQIVVVSKLLYFAP